MKTKHKTVQPRPLDQPYMLGESHILHTEPDDTELKDLLKAIYQAGAIGSHRSLSDDVAAVRRLV